MSFSGTPEFWIYFDCQNTRPRFKYGYFDPIFRVWSNVAAGICQKVLEILKLSIFDLLNGLA